MITLFVTRVYKLEVEPEWFEETLTAPVTPGKIAQFYMEDLHETLDDTLADAEIVTQNILVGD